MDQFPPDSLPMTGKPLSSLLLKTVEITLNVIV